MKEKNDQEKYLLIKIYTWKETENKFIFNWTTVDL